MLPAVSCATPPKMDSTEKNTEEGSWLLRGMVCSLRAGYKDSDSLAWGRDYLRH